MANDKNRYVTTRISTARGYKVMTRMLAPGPDDAQRRSVIVQIVAKHLLAVAAARRGLTCDMRNSGGGLR